MAKVNALTERTIAERCGAVKDEATLWGEGSEQTRALAMRIRERALEAELPARVGDGCCRRTAGWHKGGDARSLLTRWGSLGVRRPRARHKLPPATVRGRFPCRAPAVDGVLRQAFFRRVSTRQAGEGRAPVRDGRPLAQTIARVVQALDAEGRHGHGRWLGDTRVALLVTGVSMRGTHPGGVEQQLGLVASGLGPDGSRAIPDVTLALSARPRGASWQTCSGEGCWAGSCACS